MDFSILDISMAGMSFQKGRVSAVAQNIANMGSVRSADGYLFRPLVAEPVCRGGCAPVQAVDDRPTVMLDGYRLVQRQEAIKRVFNPEHPAADAEGFIEVPDINLVDEMSTLTQAMRSYEANARVMSISRGMVLKALEIGKRV